MFACSRIQKLLCADDNEAAQWIHVIRDGESCTINKAKYTRKKKPPQLWSPLQKDVDITDTLDSVKRLNMFFKNQGWAGLKPQQSVIQKKGLLCK